MFFKTLPTMTELEIKESKIILKYDENEMLGLPPPPIKSEPITMRNYEQDYAEDSNEMDGEETKPEMSMDDFMQYVEFYVSIKY